MRYATIGGQAVIEGVMMRNGNDYAVAVRKPDQTIEVKKDQYIGLNARWHMKKIPIIRGVLSFIDSLVLGMSTLTYSASFFEDEEETEKAKEKDSKSDAVFMGLTGLLMMFLCPYVFRILTPDPNVRQLAARVLRIGLLAEPLYGISIVAAGALRGTGDTFVPSLMNLGSIWIVRIGLATLLVCPLGLQGVWIAMATELCVRGLLMLYRHKTTPYYKKTPTAGPL